MKKIFFLIMSVSVSLSLLAQDKLYIYKHNSNIDFYLISEVDSISFALPTTEVMDICHNVYPVVKIGKQYWMAENMRCNKYDTQSEAYNASWLTDNTLPTNNDEYTPSYTDATDKTKWDKYKEFVGNLTDEHVAKFGFLYNWAAAVGLDDGNKQRKQFTVNRQGICPNGWHIPTYEDIRTLRWFILDDQDVGAGSIGKHLKTESGWYSKNGKDTYGFAALPAGEGGVDNIVSNPGGFAYFWSTELSNSDEDDPVYPYYYELSYDYNDFYSGSQINYIRFSVRCIRNE